jgi:hypothetical protein
MAAAAVENQRERLVGHGPPDLLQEALETEPVRPRQVEHHARAGGRLDRNIEPEPFVLIGMDPGRPRAERAPAPTVTNLEPEARLVERKDAPYLVRLKRSGELIF